MQTRVVILAAGSGGLELATTLSEALATTFEAIVRARVTV
jgi:NADH dehydrogenase FAD-containing subunit